MAKAARRVLRNQLVLGAEEIRQVAAERVLPAGEYEIRVNLGPKNEDAGEIVRTIRVAEDIVP